MESGGQEIVPPLFYPCWGTLCNYKLLLPDKLLGEIKAKLYVKWSKIWKKGKKFILLCFERDLKESLRENGLMAEWLGRGLQNLVQRFESASDLKKMPHR